MTHSTTPDSRKSSTAWFVLLIVVVGLALGAAIIPWADCPACLGESGPRAPGSDYPHWLQRCVVCRDRGKLSFLRRITREPLDADIGCFCRSWFSETIDLQRAAMEGLVRRNGLDPATTLRSGGEALNWIDHGFVRSGPATLFLVALSCNEGSFGDRHPTPFPGRMYLFDLQGRMVDSLEIRDANGRAGVRFHVVFGNKPGDPPFEVRVFLRSELSKGPANLDLIHRQKTRRLLSGFTAPDNSHHSHTLGRIFIGNGALEFRE